MILTYYAGQCLQTLARGYPPYRHCVPGALTTWLLSTDVFTDPVLRSWHSRSTPPRHTLVRPSSSNVTAFITRSVCYMEGLGLQCYAQRCHINYYFLQVIFPRTQIIYKPGTLCYSAGYIMFSSGYRRK